MNAPLQSDPSPSDEHGEPERASVPVASASVPAAAAEQVDALPVLADGSTVVHAYPLPGAMASMAWGSSPAVMPAVQAAAVAAGGFIAGAAVVGLVHRRQRRTAGLAKGRRGGRAVARGKRTGRGPANVSELVQIVGSRSLLVDVHLLGER